MGVNPTNSPNIVATNSDASQVLGSARKSEIATSSKAKATAKELAGKWETMKNSAPAEKEDETEEEELLPEQEWTRADGKSITASVVRVEGDQVVFRLKGREIPYPIADLSEESQEKIKEAAGEKDTEEAEDEAGE